MSEQANILLVLKRGIPQDELPPFDVEKFERDPSVPHAPTQNINKVLSKEEQKLAIRNALRYFPKKFHKQLAKDFFHELQRFGHIYMYRFLPKEYEMKAYPIDCYPAKCKQAAAIMVMVQNNLDPKVAQFPHELVTYGTNGSVFSNWAQYLMTMKYLSEMTEEQTLAMYSGHPMGLFPSFSKESPRLIISNGITVPNYSTREDYLRNYALGTTIYGQMTAGSYCYIGPQGIVHGTTITVLNAFRKYSCSDQKSSSSSSSSDSSNINQISEKDQYRGKVFITSGLGGMSGAQPKAGVIVGCITVVAEVNWNALEKRYKQGWVQEICKTLDECVERIKEARNKKEVTSIAYYGNIVDLWERCAQEAEKGQNFVDLGSDQTSLHNPYGGGYYPVGYSVEESNEMIKNDPEKFKECVQQSLRRHVKAINILTSKGMKFWDYGNSFLLEASRANADVLDPFTKSGFKYPSYVQDIMGDVFSLGFGPFRWVCLTGNSSDLDKTDQIAAEVIQRLKNDSSTTTKSKQQYEDNYIWISQAKDHKLVVGSQARILYSDARGRREIALAFNEAVRNKVVSGPIVLSRDHHDVSGADSPYRETSNVYDGSNKLGDMAIHTAIGNSFRGATWVAIHNGGGTGWGEALNCGFGLVLDGSKEVDARLQSMLFWDVYNGIARRAWAGNGNAMETLQNETNPLLVCTMAQHVTEEEEKDVIDTLF